MKNIKQNFLGVVWPVDGIGNPDYELLRLDRWLTKCGLGQVTVRLDYSQAGVSHTHDELFKTGSLEALLPPAKRLAEAGASSLVWACTSGSFIGGLDWAKRQVNVLKDATGLPTISTTLALIEAVTYLDCSHVDVLGAYPEPVTEAFVDCLKASGFSVDAVVALDCADGSASFNIDVVAEVSRFASIYPENSHPLLLPDTAINTLDLLDDLEHRAGRPVITANQATVWSGLRLLGLDTEFVGGGSLFSDPTSGSDLQ